MAGIVTRSVIEECSGFQLRPRLRFGLRCPGSTLILKVADSTVFYVLVFELTTFATAVAFKPRQSTEHHVPIPRILSILIEHGVFGMNGDLVE